MRYARVAAVLSAVGAALGVLASRHDTFPLDHAVMARVQAIGPVYEPVATVFNEGNAVISIALVVGGVAVVLVRRRPDAALVLLMAASLRPYLNPLKAYVDRPRPVGDFPVLDVVGNSSFPSGHVMTAVVFLGCWFVLAPDIVPQRWVRPVRIACVVAVMLYALSRMWAGVHWFSDAYGGLIWGAALVAGVMALRPLFTEGCDRAAESWHSRRNP